MYKVCLYLLIGLLILNLSVGLNVTTQAPTRVLLPGDSIKMPAEGAIGTWREISLVNRPDNGPRYLAERGGRSVNNGAVSSFETTTKTLLISTLSTIFLII